MIRPEDNVVYRLALGGVACPSSGRDGHRDSVLKSADSERARRVESDALDRGVGDLGVAQNVLASFGDAVPDWGERAGLAPLAGSPEQEANSAEDRPYSL
jgi:hypothetical protein